MSPLFPSAGASSPLLEGLLPDGTNPVGMGAESAASGVLARMARWWKGEVPPASFVLAECSAPSEAAYRFPGGELDIVSLASSTEGRPDMPSRREFSRRFEASGADLRLRREFAPDTLPPSSPNFSPTVPPVSWYLYARRAPYDGPRFSYYADFQCPPDKAVICIGGVATDGRQFSFENVATLSCPFDELRRDRGTPRYFAVNSRFAEALGPEGVALLREFCLPQA